MMPTAARQPQKNAHPRRCARGVLVVVLLLALAGQALWAAITNSATTDESEHIGSGIAAWRTGDFRMSVTHPPLMDMICAAADLAAGAPPLPLDSEDWREARHLDFTHSYFWRGAALPRAPLLIFMGRLPVIAVSMALALLVFGWARRLYGWPAAGLALALYCFEPDLLAHSSLATNDLGVAAASVLCVYAYWRYLRCPSRPALALTGVALGVALLAKFSGVLLLAVLPLLALGEDVAAARRGDPRRLPAARFVGGLAVIIAIACLVVWAGYGFGLQPVSRSPGAAVVPAGQFISGLLFRFEQQKRGEAAFLLGQTSRTGWWYYFPVAFALKTPLPLMLLLAIALGLRRFSRDEMFLLVPVAVFLIAAMIHHVNIGLRHILPIYPFLIIFAARTLSRPWPTARPRWGRVAVGVLAAWTVVEALLYAPQYIPYFNELAGGPAGGHRYLTDSNIDWGQDLERLAAWQRRNPDKRPLYLSYSGTAYPPAYGVRARPLPGISVNWPNHPVDRAWYTTASMPRAGWIAISVTCLRLDMRDVLGSDVSYAWLAYRRPVARAGYSIFIYHVPKDEIAARAVPHEWPPG